MKRILTTILILISVSYYSYAQSGWFWQNPLPQGNKLTDLALLSSGKLFATGQFGTITNTTDNGISWNCSYNLLNLKSDLTTFYKYSDNILYTGTASSHVLKSTDAGQSWSDLSVIAMTYGSISRLFFINESTGFAITSNSYLYKTTNSGINWMSLFGFNEMQDVMFINNTTGFVAGGRIIDDSVKIYRTTNTGLNWQRIGLQLYNGIYRIKFANDQTGYATMYGELLKTTNAGLNWTEIPVSSGMHFFDLQIFDANNIYAVNYNNYLYKSSNGGLNWISFPAIYGTFNTYGINTLSFANMQTGYIIEGSHIIERTTNAGLSWTILTSSPFDFAPLETITFVNENTGFIACWTDNQRGIIKKTTDAGNSWLTVFTGNSASGHNYDIQFLNSNTGYVVGGNSKAYIYKTVNNGNNWVTVDSIGHGRSERLFFTDVNTGFILGYDSELFRTTNGGYSWTTIDSGNVSYRYSGIDFINSTTGFICSGGPTRRVRMTINGGLNWTTLYTNSSNYGFYSIKFINTMTGFLCTNGVLKTSDGGMSWNQKLPISGLFVYRIFFLNQTVGYCCANNGRIFKTTDAGENWGEQSSPTSNYLSDIYFINQNTGYCLGDQGAVLKTTDGGGNIIGIRSISNDIPEQFFLSQNYPNPFNPITKIKFDIPSDVKREKSNVKLIIYDILGRKVATLVNEALKPGSYEAEWPATGGGSNFASGIYFYSLQTEDFIQTKKMVLMK